VTAAAVEAGLSLEGLPTVDDSDQRGQERKLAELDGIANGLCAAGRDVRVVHDWRRHEFRIVPRQR